MVRSRHKRPDVVHVTRAPFIKRAGNNFEVGKGGVETAMAGAVPGNDFEIALDVISGTNPEEVGWLRTEVDKRTVSGLEGRHDIQGQGPVTHVILEQMLKAPEFEDFRRMSILWWWIHHRNQANLHTDATRANFLGYFDRYNKVSYGISRKMAEEGLLHPDVPVLIHDAYYFPRIPQGVQMINRYRKYDHLEPISARLIGINHIPFPSVPDLGLFENLDIPELQSRDSNGVAMGRKVVMHYLAGWAGLNAVSFHTSKDAENFRRAINEYLSGYNIQMPELIVNPLGINIEHVRTIVDRATPADRERIYALFRKKGVELDLSTLKDKTVFADIGTRADPIKRLPLKLRGFQELLHQRPDLRGKIVLVQQIRQHRQEYASYRVEYEDLLRLQREINIEYGDMQWQPIVIVDEPLSNTDVLLSYRMLAEHSNRFSGCFTGYEGMCLSAQESAIAAAGLNPGLVVTEEAGVGATLLERGINTQFIIPPSPSPRDVAQAMGKMCDASLDIMQTAAAGIYETIEDIELSRWRDRIMNSANKA